MQSVELGNSGIYCKLASVKYELGAPDAGKVDTRLIAGIFKMEAIKVCTRTGQTPRYTKHPIDQPIVGLNQYALRVITG